MKPLKHLVPSSRGFLAGLTLAVLVALSSLILFVPSAFAYEQAEVEFLNLLNNYRQSIGVQPLEMNAKLYDAAENFSYEMGVDGFFGHTSLDGRTFADRIRAAGYTYNTSMGENLLAGYESAQSAFDAWRNSPGHDANMRNGSYCAVGVGRVYVPGSVYGWYWTTEFGGVCEGGQQPQAAAAAPNEPQTASPTTASEPQAGVTTPSQPSSGATTPGEHSVPQAGDVIPQSEPVPASTGAGGGSPAVNFIYVFNLFMQLLFLISSV